MIESTLPPLRIKGRSLLPIVQGGMGVGVSAHRLAGTCGPALGGGRHDVPASICADSIRT
jgi:NAD(P)H-dependent flavin oxidoreductase YrpB (nitropropane dioxygenase family)